MSKTIRLNKGYDIRIEGDAVKVIGTTEASSTYAVKPTDFLGVWPKLLVQEGQEVKAGTPLFYDKNNEDLRFTSPVSGEISDIVRGDKRKILEIRILADGKQQYETFKQADPTDMDRNDIIDQLMKSGLWPSIRQRPFARIADHKDAPKSIFVSAFDSAPLAPDMDYIVEGRREEFQTGLNALKQLTDGAVHLNVHATKTKSDIFLAAKGVEVNRFEGPHPAGVPGIQIHHIDPADKNNSVWYVQPQDVIAIGALFLEGKLNLKTRFAVTGHEVKVRKYYDVIRGACIEPFVKGNVTDKKLRYISGNVLTGTKIEADGYLGFYDSHITVIPEGDEHEFMGWLLPSYLRPTISKTFPWAIIGDENIKYKVNTNMNGEERAFVVSGQYEKVLPMDIYPVHLLKAIMIGDFDAMEGLGIYEVAEEDFALCEFVCTSKTPVQRILRQGLDLLESEG